MRIYNQSRNTLIGATLIVLIVALYFVNNGLFTLGDDARTEFLLRNNDYPRTYISEINLDLASPNHWVTLTWTGRKALHQNCGPFRSSPGKGLGENDCNDLVASNYIDSHCTPKGRRVVEGFNDSLPTDSSATYVTWIDMPRAIAFHFYPEVPDYPASSGCIRLGEKAAQLIHNNSIIGKTVVEIDGVWTRPIDRDKLRQQLIANRGVQRKLSTDSFGNPTIGVGFNFNRSGARATISDLGADYESLIEGREELTHEEIDSLLELDIDDAIAQCHHLFPEFSKLSDARQRVLVDMMLDLGIERFSSFKKLIAALRNRNFERAAIEMKDSEWYRQAKDRAIALEAMMKSGSDPDNSHAIEADAPIIDSQMSVEEAFEGLDKDCPLEVRQRQVLIEVRYYSFDNVLHQGQLMVDRSLINDIQLIFQIARDYRFPIGSVIPISDPRFRKNGLWDDEQSMNANNTCGFNYREIAGSESDSLHALGRAIDINPQQNPFIKRNLTVPRFAHYVPTDRGTLTHDHPIVQAFLELGWEWGGLYIHNKDYQHFEKIR